MRRLFFIVAVTLLVNGISTIAVDTLRAQPASPSKDLPVETLDRVYVPLDQLDAILDSDRRGVLLPRDEFRKLYEAARVQRQANGDRPHGIVVTHVTYNVKPSDKQLLVTAEVEFTQFSTGWQTLPLPLTGLAVEKAMLDDKSASLGRSSLVPQPKQPVRQQQQSKRANASRGTRTLYLLSDAAGRHTLRLEMSTPLVTAGSDLIAGFGLLPQTAGTLRVALPAGKHLQLEDVDIERSADINQPTVVETSVGGRSQVALRFTDRLRERAADALVFVTTGYGVSVVPGELTWHAATTLSIHGRQFDRLVLNVPRSLEIADVQSNGLESWELADNADDPSKTTITLDYRQPFDGTRTVRLKGVRSLVEGERFDVPNVEVVEATSHVGRILIQRPGNLRLQLIEAEGVRRSSSKVRPTAPSRAVKKTTNNALSNSSASVAYDVWQEKFTIGFVPTLKEREVSASMSTRVSVDRDGIELLTEAQLETRLAPLFELHVTLPADWSVATVWIGNVPVDWKTLPAQAGVHQLRIPLPEPLRPGQQQRFRMHARLLPEQWPPDTTGVEFALPEVTLPQASVVEGTLAVQYDPHFDIAPIEITGLDPALLKLTGPHLGYRYQDTDYSGQLKVVGKPTSLSASVLSFARVDEQTVKTHSEITLDVVGSGVRTLRFAVPAAVSTTLRFHPLRGTAVGVAEQKAADPENGQRIWTVRLDREFEGRAQFAVDLEQSRGDEKKFNIPVPRVLDAERTSGWIALEADGAERLRVDARGAAKQALPEVDPIDLPQPLSYSPQDRVVAAFRYVTPTHDVNVTEERFDQIAVPTAICTHAEITSVLARSGEIQQRAIFQLVPVGVQHLRLQLPEKSRLWSTLLDGKPVEVRRNGNVYLIPLPLADRPDASRRLQLYYANEVAALDMFGRLQQQPPRLSVDVGADTPQPLEVLDWHWTLHHPSDSTIISSDGRFQLQDTPDRSGLLARLQQSLALPSPTRLLWNGLFLVIAVAVVALFTATHRRFRWKGTTALVLVSGVCLLVVVGATFISWGLSQSDNAVFMTESAQVASEESYGKSTPSSGLDENFNVTNSFSGDTDESADDDASPDMEEPAAIDPFGDLAGGRKDDAKKNEEAATKTAQPGDGKKQPGTVAGLVNLNTHAGLAMQPNASPLTSGGRGNSDPGVSQPTVAQGARLSVAVDFDPPSHLAVKRFRYVGTEASDVGIDIRYEDRQAGAVFRLFVFVTVLWLMWLTRRLPPAVRGIMGIVGIVSPLALMTVVPPSWHVFLDGLFLGTLAGVILWIIHAFAPSCSRCFGSWKASLVRTTSIGLLLAFTLMAASAHADDKAASDPFSKPSSKPSPKSSSKSVKTMRAPAPNTPTIVIPYDPDGDPLAAERVFLPYAKFRELWNQAYPEKRPQPAAPVDGLVTAATYSAKLISAADGKSPHLAVTGRLVLENFRAQRITLPLPFSGIALRTAQLDGKPAAILSQPAKNGAGGRLEVVVPAVGTHVLDIEFDRPVTIAGPTGRLTLALQPIAAGMFSFTLPAAELKVKVKGGAGTYRRVKVGDGERIDVPIDRGGLFALAWQPARIKGEIAAIVQAQATTAVLLDDAGVRLATAYRFGVRQGSLSQATFSLPERLRIRHITGPDVAGWQIDGDAAARTMHVFFRRNIDDATQVVFELHLAANLSKESQQIDIPFITPQNVTRETGAISVLADEQFSVQAVKADGLVQIDVGQFQPISELKLDGRTPRLAFRYAARPVGLSLDILRRAAETKAIATHAVAIRIRKLQLDSRFRFELSGPAQSRLMFSLPEGYLPLDVQASGLSDWYVGEDEDSGETRLTIELNTSRLKTVHVFLRGAIPKESEDEFAELSVPMPVGVARLKSHLALRLDEIFTGMVDESEGWKQIPPERLPANVRSGLVGQVDFAFRASETEGLIVALALKKARPQMSAEAITQAVVSDAFLGQTLAMQWRITHSAADTFHFTTPEFLSGRLEFVADGLRRVAEEKLDDGRVRWTVLLQEPVHERFFLVAFATLPPPDKDSLSVAIPHFETKSADGEGGFAPLATQRRYVALVNLSGNRLTPTDSKLVESAKLADIRIDNLDSLSSLGRLTMLARVRKAVASVDWKLQRSTRQRAAAAMVHLADLVTVVEQDGSYRGQATYTVRNQARQFLPLIMPPTSRFLSVYVNGAAERPVLTKRGGKAIHLIAIPKTSRTDPAYAVKVVFAGRLKSGPLPRGVQMRRGELDLPTPRVLSSAQDKAFGIPVGRALWTVHLPEGIDVVPVDGMTRNNFIPATLAQLSAHRRGELLKDVEQLNFVLGGSGSAKGKYNALVNLKRMQKTISQEDAQSMTRDAGELDHRNAQVQEHLYEQIAENEALLQRDVDGKTNHGPNKVFDDHPTDYGDLQRWNAVRLNEENSSVRSKVQSGKSSQTFGLDLNDLESSTKSGESDRATKGGKAAANNRSRLRTQSESQLANLGAVQKQLGEMNEKSWWKTDQSPSSRPSRSNTMALTPPMNQPGGVMTSMNRQGIFIDETKQDSEEVWSSVGGLSLDIDLPTSGQVLTFSKVGGDPKLALAARPRETLTKSLGLLWTLVWLALGVFLIVSIRRVGTVSVYISRLPATLVSIGLVLFLATTGLFAWLGFMAFLAGTVVFAVRSKSPKTATPR